MTMYFGLPVCFDEALRIFNLDHVVSEEMKELDNTRWDKTNLYPLLNDYFKSRSLTLRIYHLDKGQFVVGYKVEEPSDVWTKLINVDQMIMKLCELRTKFSQETVALHADLSDVALETMEGDRDDPQRVAFPAPYILVYE